MTAYFERATGVYPGTEVRILGVKVGKVTKVTPKGNMVEVKLTYNAKHKVPADAQAVIIVPSLVADRYIQFTPGLPRRRRRCGTARRCRCRARPCRSSWTTRTRRSTT